MIGKRPSSDEALSPIVFRLDPGSGVPTFMQLVQQVEHALSLGYLKRGDQLPRIKDVVADLIINPNTVLKAYRNLEQKGLVKGRPGQGTFVLSSPETLSLRQYTALRKKLAGGWLRAAYASGLDDSTISALMLDTLREESQRRMLESGDSDGGEVVA
jgi:GntR family transcriptional regulator